LKVAVPVEEDRGLESPIDEHFGHAPYFAIAELDGGEVKRLEILENPYAAEHGPGQVPGWLAEMGVEVLVARGMGWRALEFFESYGIRVYRGASGTLGDVLRALAEGSIRDREYEPREKWGGPP